MAKKVIAIYPGRFQPFGRHHYDAFKWLVSKFGKENTFIATSGKVELPKSPLSFEDKLAIISKYGIGDRVQLVKNPYRAEEITQKFDPKDTALVFMVGEKDMQEDPRFKIGVKKDGSPGYFQRYIDPKKMESFDKHGYLVVAPHVSYEIPGIGEMSGTNIRKALSNPSLTKDQFESIFGWYDKKIHDLMKKKFSAKNEALASLLENTAINRLMLIELLTEDNMLVKCEICGEKRKSLHPTHLKTHNITLKEYREKYPNAEIISKEVRKKLVENNGAKTPETRKKLSENNAMHNPEYRKKAAEGVKRSYENNAELRKLRGETIGIIGKQNFGKINQAKFDSGEWISPDKKEGFQGYKERVRIITEESYTKHFYDIPNAKKRSREWHLDHKYSILEAYKNGVEEEIVGHWKNLEIVHHSINESKSYKSSISLKELIEYITSVETDTRILLLCGGAPGHMAHPFDIPSVKTGKDLLSVFEKTSQFLQKNEVPVKIDGINSSIRLANLNGKQQFVLDRGSNKPLDVKGVTSKDLVDRFGEGHGMTRIGAQVLKIFNEALPSIKKDLDKLGMTKNPNIMLNIEYVEGQSNVQKYDKNFLVIHNLLEMKQVTPTKRQSQETSYSKDSLQSLIKNLDPIAKKYDFEVFNVIPAKSKSKTNFSGVLSKSYTVKINDKEQETKTLQAWLDQAQNTKGIKLKLKSGKTVDALSKQVFMWIDKGNAIEDLVADPKDTKLAIDSFVIYLATVKLGDAVLESMTSPLGDVNEQEGVVVRDKSVYSAPYKITGSFIIRGLESSFQK